MNQIANPAAHALRIEDLSLQVKLGCLPEERAQTQEVRFTVIFRFAHAPRGAATDEITDTICYAEISEVLRTLCASDEFKLIERLGIEAYNKLREFLNAARGDHKQTKLALSVHKVKPPVVGLLGGSHYECGDFYP